MLKKLYPLSARKKRFSPWRYGLKLGLAAALIVWWWLQNQEEEESKPTQTRVVLPPDDAKPKPLAKPKAKPVEPDDLARIDGIGPKYASVLKAAGVTTFVKLAKMKPEEVQEIFRGATGRVPDPSDWIKQAAKL